MKLHEKCKTLYRSGAPTTLRNWVTNSISSGERPIAQNGFRGTNPWGEWGRRDQRGHGRCGGSWQRRGLKLREYGQQHGIPQSTLTWWRRVFRHAGEQGNAASKRVRASDVVVLTEVPQPENL